MKSTYDAYYEAPESIRNLIDSGIIGDLVENVIRDTAYSVLKPKIIVLSTRFFLALISEAELGGEFTSLGINSDVTQNLTHELKKLLTESIHGISTSLESSPGMIAAEVSAMEKVLADGFTTPTEPTYTSTQSAILNEGGQWGTR